MKVLHIVPFLPKASGVTTFVVECSNALRGMGHEQTIVTKEDHADALARIDEFDIVHLHGIWPPFYHRFVIAARKRQIPIVWSIHGMLSPWAMKYKRWKKIPAWWLWQKRDLKSAAVLHVTSEREIEWVRAQGFTNRIVNIPLGTKLPDAVPARAHKPKRLLFVGRVSPIKALDNLIRAWDLVRPADWALRIVGNDERGYQASLVRLVEELQLGASVEFPGPKFGTDLEEEYRNADALVLPSHTENFGAVVADALAWGLPVITGKGTPWKEVVVGSGSGSGSGWWVENDPENLAKALRELMALSDEDRRAMGERGRELVMEKYSWAAIAEQVKSVYSQTSRLRGGVSRTCGRRAAGKGRAPCGGDAPSNRS